jgi:hypothetical protein
MTDSVQNDIAEQPATKEWVAQLVKIVDVGLTTHLQKLEERMEGIEKVQSTLTLAYAELATKIQALLEVGLEGIDVEAFNKAMKISWDDKMEAFQSGVSAANAKKPGFHPTGEPPASDPDPED